MRIQKNKVKFKKCPTCLGSGKIKTFPTWAHYTPETRAKARELFRQGMSLRKIGKEIGVNHPQKVYSLITAIKL